MYETTSLPLWLVAQTRIEPLRFAVEASEPSSWNQSGIMLTLAFVTVLIAVGWVVFLRKLAPPTSEDGRLLFSELCLANNLSRRQRRLLLELAELKKLQCPSQILMDITLWTPTPEQPSRLDDPKNQVELHRLRSLLYTHGKLDTESELNVRA